MLVACDRAPSSDTTTLRWIRLAEAGAASHALRPRESASFAFEMKGARPLSLRDGEDGRWLETTVRASEWRPATELGAGAWFAPVELWSVGRADRGGAHRLVAGSRTFEHAPPDVFSGEWHFPPGSFSASKRGLYLKLAGDESPPESSVVSVLVASRRATEDGWRIAGRRFSGDGFALHPGEAMEVEVALPTAATLRFATALEPALGWGEAEGPATRLRVWLDDAPVFETERSAAVASYEWHALELPAQGTEPARLRFEVDGALAHAAFADPVLVISEQTPRPRPPGRDVVVFLADTFRADNMEVYGGTLGLTPFLDALARRSRVQRRAWSVTTHTLPAHATIFSGLFPHQAGVPDELAVLSEEAHSIAERLADAGYRTGAITDSLVVSQSRGLAQGFAWFDEGQTTLQSTIERALAFLDADDGRPTFLFVQSYRAHTPYRITRRTMKEHGERLGIPQLTREEQRELILTSKRPGALAGPRGRQIIRDLEALYRGGVIDVDRGVGRFVSELEARQWLDDGVLLFTSDHGEAFAEHSVLFHQGVPWEELARVPFLLVGGDIEPGVHDEPVSLVDLAPTVAELASIDADPEWRGVSVLSPSGRDHVYTFEASGPGGSLAIVEGERKAIGAEREGRLRQRWIGVFDLAEDPGERKDLGENAPWLDELVERHTAGVEEALTPTLGRARIDLDAADIERLEAMGYLQGSE